MKVTRILLLFLFFLPHIVLAQDITIYPNQPFGATYCSKPVYVAPSFTMSANFSVTGMKISFSEGYIYGEDKLQVTDGGPVTGTWFAGQGYILLSGGSKIDDYVQAIRSVQYVNTANFPTNGKRIITFSLDDADYLPDTGHFYKFISRQGFSWTAAKAESESAAMKYYGIQGYLATITSGTENDFIQTKTKGVGWIGASDQASEGDWKWVTGPEGLMGNGSGLSFWKGSGYQAKTNPANYGPVNGAYHNWNRWNVPYSTTLPQTNWEPNNSGGNEGYAHITVFPTNPADSYKWNDLPNAGGNGDYVSAGYLIEYGGMPGDPQVNLSASIYINVNAVSFASIKTFTKCEGVPVELNQKDTHASYLWHPSNGLSNPFISNPMATPNVTTDYTVIATNGLCKDSVKFLLNILPAPISQLKKVEDICFGKTITLDPGVHVGYAWSTGVLTRTIISGIDGYYAVTLTGANGCKFRDSSLVVVHQYPKMDLSKLDSLFCGPSLKATLKLSSDKGTYIVTNLDTKEKFEGVDVTVPSYGNYKFTAMVTDPYGCPSKVVPINLLFHKIPDVKFTINQNVCYGYNLQADYVGTSNIPVSRFAWIFGGDTISNKLGQNIEQIPLGINQTKRDLVLKVTEDGCTGSYTIPEIIVIPDLKLFVKDSLQCQPIAFEFSATNTENVVKYEWDWGDNTPGLGKKATHIYSKEGFYDVSLKVTTDKNCTNSATIKNMVFVAPIPTVEFSIDPSKCLNQGKDTLYYIGSANQKDTYYWDLKGFDPREIVQKPDTTAGPFVFDLIYKPKTQLSLYVISQYGCRSATSTLEVKRRPVFSFTSSVKDGCAPVPVNFKAKVDDPVDQLSFNWNFGDGNLGDGADVNNNYLVPNMAHDIGLNAESSITGCRDSTFNSKYIAVHPNPKAGFIVDRDIVFNDDSKVIFTDKSTDAVDFLWDFGDKNQSKEQNPVYSYLSMGKMKILQTVYNKFECRDTTSKSVMVAFSKLFAPNAFSPNAANEVDREFKLASSGIKNEGYHLTILSRWSDVVFECKNEVKGWDGKMTNGSDAPAGNYIWIMECIDFLGRPHRQTGTVTLVF